MLLSDFFKTIPLYLDYYLNAVDEHSLQAPFVFNFYQSLKQRLRVSQAHPDIELLRHKLLKDQTLLQVNDAGAGSRINPKSGGKTIRQIAAREISSRKKCAFLSALVHEGHYSNCIELGTSLGLTTAYLSKACAEGKVFSLEGDARLCELAAIHLAGLSCTNVQIVHGNIDETLTGFLEQSLPIDCAIIDANHTGGALNRYFTVLMSNFQVNGIVIVDDIRWSRDMYSGWIKLLAHPAVTLSLEFREMGLLFIKTAHDRRHYVLENPI